MPTSHKTEGTIKVSNEVVLLMDEENFAKESQMGPKKTISIREKWSLSKRLTLRMKK
jgi:hypothetical protein